jgi:hypothetical protein
MLEPIRRYFKGYDPALLADALNYVLEARGAQTLEQQALSPDEIQGLHEVLDRHEASAAGSPPRRRQGASQRQRLRHDCEQRPGHGALIGAHRDPRQGAR